MFDEERKQTKRKSVTWWQVQDYDNKQDLISGACKDFMTLRLLGSWAGSLKNYGRVADNRHAMHDAWERRPPHQMVGVW